MPDKISVIVPIYNVEPYLRQCLDSIVNQTYRNLQIILVDDGSPDRCGEIADEYARGDDRIVVLHKKNAGVSAARNDGIHMAAGEWISFVDPDDWLDLDYYEKAANEFPVHKTDVVIMGGCIYEYGWGGRTVRSFTKSKEVEERCRDKEYLLQKMFSYRYGHDNCFPYYILCVPWNKLFRAAFLQEKKIEFPLGIQVTEDGIFTAHVFLETDSVDLCEYFGYHYRQLREQSAVNRFDPQWPAMVDCSMAKFEALIGKEELYGKYKDTISTFIFIMYLDGILKNDCFHADNPASYRETAQVIKTLKRKDYFARAIWSNDTQYMVKKALVLRYLMRLPAVWPLKLFYMLLALRKKVQNRCRIML